MQTLSELSNEISGTREHVSESASFKHTVLSKNRTHLLQAPLHQRDFQQERMRRSPGISPSNLRLGRNDDGGTDYLAVDEGKAVEQSVDVHQFRDSNHAVLVGLIVGHEYPLVRDEFGVWQRVGP
jgi:hypothetical protein